MSIYHAIDIGDFPEANHFRYRYEVLRKYLQSINQFNLPSIEDAFVVGHIKFRSAFLNKHIVLPESTLLIPLYKDHVFELPDRNDSESEIINTSVDIVYSKAVIKQIMGLILQNHNDLIDNKEWDAINRFEFNIEFIKNKPELVMSILQFEKNAELYIENNDSLSFDLSKYKILFDALMSIFGKRKSESILKADKTIRDEIVHRIIATVEYMHDHFAKDIRLDELAKIANLSTGYFAATFTQVMKNSPLAYLIHVRMDKAKELIETTTLPIEKVANQVGFNNLAAFYRNFKSFFGIPPATYRKEHRKTTIHFSQQ